MPTFSATSVVVKLVSGVMARPAQASTPTSINTVNSFLPVSYTHLRPPRGNPGSTDYGVVTGKVPSCCLRVKTITEPIPPHTDEWVEAGTKAQNYRGVHDGAKAVAAAAYRVLTEPGVFEAMQKALVEEHA